MDYGKLTLKEIQNGYKYNEQLEEYVCNYCGKVFPKGQVFPIDGNLFEPEYAVSKHIEHDHDGNFSQLLHADTKYNTLTDHQKKLFAFFHAGMSDKEIAKELNVTPSTVRRQKFTFRERAKQARFYLAVYEHAFENRDADEEAIIPVHDQAVYCDDRYIITETERAHILETAFDSLVPLKLREFSPKEKKKIVILERIAQTFKQNKTYTEREVNEILKSIYQDYVTIRRYLVMYGFMERTKDGSGYWLT